MPPDVRSSPTLHVCETVQAGLLFDDRVRRVLAPFVGQACSASRAADRLGMPLSSLLYQVRRLLNAKLLIVVREERRAGRAVRHYRAAAERFIVPYTLTPAETPEMLLAAQHAGPDARLRRHLTRAGLELLEQQGLGGVGVQVVLDGPRLVLRNMVGPDAEWNFLDPGAPAMVDYWLEDVHLEFEEAKALQAELCELVARYKERQETRGGQTYVLRLALAPQHSGD
ncbi:helix-turn-helix transcriptional regulator [Deinococcus sp. Arct2-2]|uniref:helix-turn-helix transcriptional regulator n=1 Tax=Deinococcus sp. Arct2-2 TaxID=2568653 RepID=UPI0010A36000|nr:helix-turn-helix transcriptional regulator [Deinococcus sp. Arct2-2]THF67888.1 helix-turn-helix transcriptional regulator [Deinococcus sp. Arct2-2]